MTIMSANQPVSYDPERGALLLLDQTLIPREEKTLHLTDVEAICEAIYMLCVRGAPAIGVAAAYGICAVARNAEASDVEGLIEEVARKAAQIGGTRPTAVNLMVAVERMRPVWQRGADSAGALCAALEEEARALHDYEVGASQAMGRNAFEIFEDGDGVITHCNTGALAAPGIGTALGTVLWAVRNGKALRVWADETRPLLQGGRLTTWECIKDGIPCTLLTDNMAAVALRDGMVQKAIVGADRVAANGDAANKIGTYGLAVLCKHHGVPFYIAAPMTTVDFNTPTGAEIPIEQRKPEEVRGAFGTIWAPEQVEVFNPAFDVTPAELIAGIVTDQGLARPPFTASLAGMRSATDLK